MLKASWGGGGRGMRAIRSEADLAREVTEGKREAKAAFGKDEVYLEKLIERARHVEVQVLGDTHGNAVHLFERDCSIQRRNQKVVERAPAPYLSEALREELCGYALKIARETSYIGAGTVEFLQDADTGKFYFIEVNPRIQVEHTVTEQVTGIDIVKAQIHILDGFAIGTPESGVPAQEDIRLNGHALQCRITTEDPEHNFIPDYGRITAYRGATGFGIRLDGGTAYSGAVITRFYDPLLEKVTAWAPTPAEAIARMNRALREFRIRGVATNLTFLEAIINHPSFADNSYTTRFIDTTPELFAQVKRQDRATKLLNYLADVTVNGHPETRGRPMPKADAAAPVVPYLNGNVPGGSKQKLDALGPEKFAAWMREQKEVLVTDTTMRDGHQSLLATRMRTHDIAGIAGTYARALPQLLSLECWGGATFDVAMRFLTEDPWERLALVREAAPNLLLQMLLRGANGVGYTNYPDNVVQHFVKQAAAGGIDLFRVFDCLNWVENMRVAMDAVGAEGKLCEAAICYTGDILDPARAKYDLKYYVGLAKELQAAGAHIIAVKDMAGLLKPAAARVLFKALREATDLPIHFHTHDTSGLSAATVLAAVESGVDAIDAAMDSFSGNTSQPCLGSIVEALKGTERDPGLDPQWIRNISFYWEAVRNQYAAFESDLKGPASEVYLHEMPGGQFTNLKEQARSLGLETRWHEVAQAYHDVNLMFGDIVKVTPSSKVVGDMALMMVSQDLTVADVENPAKDIAFPDSVVSMLRGDLGQSPGGWPRSLQKKALKGDKPITVRPGSLLKPADLKASRKEIEEKLGAQALGIRIRLLADVSEGVFRLRRRAGDLRAGQRAADADLFLRHEVRGRDLRRHREGQDAGGALPGDRRCRRQGHGHRVLRAQRPAAPRQGAGPRAWRLRGQGAAQGRARQRGACRRADAGRRLGACGCRRPGGQGRRRAAVDRGDEDGDGAACRARRHGRRSAGQGRRPDRRQGSADRIRLDALIGRTRATAGSSRSCRIDNGLTRRARSGIEPAPNLPRCHESRCLKSSGEKTWPTTSQIPARLLPPASCAPSSSASSGSRKKRRPSPTTSRKCSPRPRAPASTPRRCGRSSGCARRTRPSARKRKPSSICTRPRSAWCKTVWKFYSG